MIVGAVVLAGGRSRRMGRPKEALPFDGSTLLGHAVETLLLCVHPVIVVAREGEQELPPLPIESELVFDEQPGEGPLAAMATGLRAIGSRSDAVLVTTCDAPFVDAAVVDWLAHALGEHDAVVPVPDHEPQPLVALYRPRVLTAVDALLAAGERAPRALLDRIDALRLEGAAIDAFDRERRFLRDVDTPDDYQQLGG